MYDWSALNTNVLKSLWAASSIYIVWNVVHHTAAWCYAQYCIPRSLVGLLLTPFLIPSPLCTGLRWCVNSGAEMISSMWVAIATWFASSVALLKVKD